MFNWLRRLLSTSQQEQRRRLFETADTLNAATGGGYPTTVTRVFGALKLRSNTLALGDPQCIPGGELDVSNIDANEAVISGSLWHYPSGAETVTSLTVTMGEPSDSRTLRKIGEVGIDSAKLIVADKADLEEHWTEIGKDRIGVISTAPDDAVLRMLTERFRLKTARKNPVRSEVVGPVSEALAKEIEDYLKSQPMYADYPFLYFHVQTNNSFERANYLAKSWDFLRVGNDPAALMFVCGTGRGDGSYEVRGEFADGVPRILRINFIEEEAADL
jgi:hypothetical protein